MEESRYSVGDIWTYNTRYGEESSKLYIVKIEHDKELGVIYHIYLDNVKMINKFLKNGIQGTIQHLPVSKTTLDESVVELVGNDSENLPDISDGYNAWKEADGSVFTITITKIIQYIEVIINERKIE